MKVLTKHALERLAAAAAILAVLAAIGGALWLKWGSSESDYQRLNALERRVERIEEARVIVLEDIGT